MYKIDAAMMKIEEAVGNCTDILASKNPANNLSRDSSEYSELQDSLMETFTVEVIRSNVEPEVSEPDPLGSELPCATTGKDDSYPHPGKEDEKDQVFIDFDQNQSMSFPFPAAD